MRRQVRERGIRGGKLNWAQGPQYNSTSTSPPSPPLPLFFSRPPRSFLVFPEKGCGFRILVVYILRGVGWSASGYSALVSGTKPECHVHRDIRVPGPVITTGNLTVIYRSSRNVTSLHLQRLGVNTIRISVAPLTFFVLFCYYANTVLMCLARGDFGVRATNPKGAHCKGYRDFMTTR